jgi:NADH-quinone oxidoreductase subunit N
MSLFSLVNPMLPELLMVAVACALFLLGISRQAWLRHFVPYIALVTLLVALGIQSLRLNSALAPDNWMTVQTSGFVQFIKFIAAAVGSLLVLLAWPTNPEGTASPAIDYGEETAEFFALMLLSLAGLFLVAEANDIMLLFLGIELASIPTYIMVSVSRPLPVAQEAGVKYFFLGAMAAAVLLFGFSYLFGVTGTTTLFGTEAHAGIAERFAATPAMIASGAGGWSSWQMLAVVMVIVGLAFKMAAVPMHVYAADVYQGAATPVTAFLSFVPKASGFVALVRVLYAAGGGTWHMPHQIVELLWVLAVLTMTFGNVLGLLQFNLKRVFAYSSIAHSGYMLVGVTALVGSWATVPARAVIAENDALRGVLFYLAVYGVTSTAALGILILLPSRTPAPATTAETFEDLAGVGHRHLLLALAMSIACFSLTGLPLTVGFWGKFMLLEPALHGGFYWLAAITMLNAAISAAYYLKIVAALFLRADPDEAHAAGGMTSTSNPAPMIPAPAYRIGAVETAVGICVFAVLVFGTILQATNLLSVNAQSAGQAIRSSPPTQASSGLAQAATASNGQP